jgi:hypothetical protein
VRRCATCRRSDGGRRWLLCRARERVVWQDTQSIARDEEWVDVNYGVDGNGSALVLDLDAATQIELLPR